MSTAGATSADSLEQRPQSRAGDLPSETLALRERERGRIRRLIRVAIVLAFAALGGAGAWYWWQQQEHALPEGIAKANGRLEAEQVEIATKFAGRIAAVLAGEGQMVDAGQ